MAALENGNYRNELQINEQGVPKAQEDKFQYWLICLSILVPCFPCCLERSLKGHPTKHFLALIVALLQLVSIIGLIIWLVIDTLSGVGCIPLGDLPKEEQCRRGCC